MTADLACCISQSYDGHHAVCEQVGTPQYDREFQAVKLYGAKNSTARDPYQQLTPYFWADDVSKSPSPLAY